MAAILLPHSLALPGDVLIVEDDPIIALDLEDTISGFGIGRVRVAATVERALEMIAESPPDFALLDVGLTREMSFEVAAELDRRGIRFAFVTGYDGDRVPPSFARYPRLAKPCPSDALIEVLGKWSAG